MKKVILPILMVLFLAGYVLAVNNVTIVAPVNGSSYPLAYTGLTYVLTGSTFTSCASSDDGGITNKTIACGVNVTTNLTTSGVGTYTWYFYGLNGTNVYSDKVTFTIRAENSGEFISNTLTSTGQGLGGLLESIRTPLIYIVVTFIVIGAIGVFIYSIGGMLKGAIKVHKK